MTIILKSTIKTIIPLNSVLDIQKFGSVEAIVTYWRLYGQIQLKKGNIQKTIESYSKAIDILKNQSKNCEENLELHEKLIIELKFELMIFYERNNQISKIHSMTQARVRKNYTSFLPFIF